MGKVASYRREQDALESLKSKRKGDGSAVANVANTAKAAGEDVVYREVSSQAMLELLHSDKFRPQHNNIETVFHTSSQEKCTTVPIEILQAVEHRERILQVKTVSFKAMLLKSSQQNAELTTANGELRKQLKDALEQNAKLTDEQKILSKRVERDRTEIGELVEELIQLKNATDDAMDSERRLTSKCEAIEQLLEEGKTENTRLIEEVVRLETEVADRDKLERELHATIRDQQLKIDIAEESLEQCEHKMEQLQDALLLSQERGGGGGGGGTSGGRIPSHAKRCLASYPHELRENSSMMGVDYDSHEKDADRDALKKSFRKHLHAVLNGPYRHAIVPRTDKPILDNEHSDILSFLIKQESLEVKAVTEKQLEIVEEAAKLSLTVSQECTQLLKETLPKVLGFIPEHCIPSDIGTILGKRTTECSAALDKSFATILRLFKMILLEQMASFRTKASSVKTFCGGPCKGKYMFSEKHTNTIPTETRSIEVSCVVSTNTVATGKNNTGTGLCKNEEVELEGLILTLSKYTRGALANAGVREQGYPVGLKVARKNGVSLLSSCVDGIEMVNEKLNAMFHKGKSAGIDSKQPELVIADADEAKETNETMGDRPVMKKLREMAQIAKERESRGIEKKIALVKKGDPKYHMNSSAVPAEALEPKPPAPLKPSRDRFAGFLSKPDKKPSKHSLKELRDRDNTDVPILPPIHTPLHEM